jgi:Flp pilus assembly protein TadD/peroxiredoxin
LEQTFAKLPANRRIEIHEGSADFVAKPFLASPESWAQPRSITTGEELPSSHATWLVDPVSAPDFSLPDLAGNLHDLRSFQGRRVLLNFWQLDSPASCNQLRALNKSRAALQAKGIDVVALNLDEASALTQVHVFGEKETLGIPVLVAGGEVAGIYNIVFRYLFDRHRDLPLPTSFLVDETGNIVRVYQGIFTADQLIADLANLPRTPAERLHLALPFPGTLHRDSFQRNAFTYGVAFFQRGFLDQAVRSFQQVFASDPENADAYYNLGTLYLRRHDLQGARQHLEQSVRLRPNYPEAWNNLGMLAAQQGSNDEAIRDFQQSLQLRPDYVTALLNLGNIHRRLGNFDASEALLKRALDREPSNSEVEYNLGMLYARKGDTSHAEESLNAAIKLRPDYADALNNLGVLLVQEQRFTEAEDKFKACILKAPAFDQAYLNLARLHIARNEKEKARAVLQALLQQQPEHKMARQMLQLLY